MPALWLLSPFLFIPFVITLRPSFCSLSLLFLMSVNPTDINVMVDSLGWIPVEDADSAKPSLPPTQLLPAWSWVPPIQQQNQQPTFIQPISIPAQKPAARKPASNSDKHRDHIPRPSNSFILFRVQFSRLNKGRGWDNVTLSQQAGEAWQQLPFLEKQFFVDQAAEHKRLHALSNPTYRYNPVHKLKAKSRRKSESRPTPLPAWESTPQSAPRRPRAASAPGVMDSFQASQDISPSITAEESCWCCPLGLHVGKDQTPLVGSTPSEAIYLVSALSFTIFLILIVTIIA